MDNYFELFDLPQTLAIDSATLKRTFFIKSREYHPDFYTQASETEQAKALTMTSLYNTAFEVLSNPQSALAHLLAIHSVEVSGNNQALPQAFLFEMMDLNEAIEEASTTEQRAAVAQQVDRFEAELLDTASDLFSSEDLSGISDIDLNRLKEVYLKRQYLKRLRQAL